MNSRRNLAATVLLLAILAGALFYAKQRKSGQPGQGSISSAPGLSSVASGHSLEQVASNPEVTNFTSQIVMPSLDRFIVTLKSNGVFFPFGPSDFVVTSQQTVPGGVLTQGKLGPYSIIHDYSTNFVVRVGDWSMKIIPCDRIVSCDLSRKFPIWSPQFLADEDKLKSFSEAFGWEGSYDAGKRVITQLADSLNVRSDDLGPPSFHEETRNGYPLHIVMAQYPLAHITGDPNLVANMPPYDYELIPVAADKLSGVFGNVDCSGAGNTFVLLHFGEMDASFERPIPPPPKPIPSQGGMSMGR